MIKHTETWREVVAKWDKGDIIWSAALTRGTGPGYEQTVQILLWEILSQWGDRPLPKPGNELLFPNELVFPEDYLKHSDEVANKLDSSLKFSGMQVDLATATAYQIMRCGYSEFMDDLPPERHIQVSKYFPSPFGNGQP